MCAAKGESLSGAGALTIRSMLAQPRFEVIPLKGAVEETLTLPERSIVTVTASPRKGIEATLTLSEELAEHNYKVVPHLTARQVKDKAHLKEIIDRLIDKNFDDVFVIGGDITTPVGIYSSAVELMADMVELKARPMHIGIAAYPEGHPLISKDALLQALKSKQPMADYMVTQICFDAGTIMDWLRQMRAAGITLPVYIGIPGVVKRSKLLEISMRVGVGESARFLKNHLGMIGTLLRQDIYSPEGLVKKISALSRGMDVSGFHIYTFNQCKATERWRQKAIKTGRTG